MKLSRDKLSRARTRTTSRTASGPPDRIAGGARVQQQPASYGDVVSTRNLLRRDDLAPGFETETATTPGGTRSDEVRATEEQQDEAIEEQIEEREDILDDAGGNSDATDVLGDEEGEEIVLLKNVILSDFVTELSADGFYQSISPVYSSLSNASVVERTRSKLSTSALIGKTMLKSNRTFLEDYRVITRLAAPELDLATRRLVYSELEKSQISSRLVNSEILNQSQLLQSIENFLDAPQSPSFEGSIITNRFESTKKIKLSAFPPDAPVLPPIEPTTSTDYSSTTSGGSSPTTSAGSSY